MKLIDPASLGATLKDLLRADSTRLIDESGYLRARLSDRAPQGESRDFFSGGGSGGRHSADISGQQSNGYPAQIARFEAA